MNSGNGVLKLMEKEFADDLAEKLRASVANSRNSYMPMERVLRPLIDAIAELHVAMEWRRIPGYVLADPKPVPGVGPILRVERREGSVCVTRSDGNLNATWIAAQSGWEITAFDDIPEDIERAEQCRCGGRIQARPDGRWECDTCNWVSALIYPAQADDMGANARDKG